MDERMIINQRIVSEAETVDPSYPLGIKLLHRMLQL